MSPVYVLVPCGSHAALWTLPAAAGVYSEKLEIVPVERARNVGPTKRAQ
jgi:hypothetical protein